MSHTGRGNDSKANVAYGTWKRFLADNPGVPLDTSINVYRALVQSVNRYGSPFSLDKPTDTKVAGDGERHKGPRKALRRAMGLPDQPSNAFLFAATGQQSLVSLDHTAALQYWAGIPE